MVASLSRIELRVKSDNEIRIDIGRLQMRIAQSFESHGTAQDIPDPLDPD